MSLRFRLAAPFAFVLACALPSEVRTAAAPGVSFDRYHTFMFDSSKGAPEGYTATDRAVEVQGLMTPLIRTALAQKGYVESNESPDLIVAHGVGRRDATETHHVYRSSRLGGDDEYERSFVEGILVVDVYDAKSKEVVWHGVATGEVKSSGVDQKRLGEVVAKIMAGLPATKPNP